MEVKCSSNSRSKHRNAQKRNCYPKSRCFSPSCALLIAACALSTTSTPTSAMISSSYVIATTAVDFPLTLNETRFLRCSFFLFWRFSAAAVAWGWKRWKVTKKSFLGVFIDFCQAFSALAADCGGGEVYHQNKASFSGFQTLRGRFNPPCVV